MSTHEEYGQLRDRMVAVETKLDLVLAQLAGTHADHEARIRFLEQRVDPSNAEHERRITALEHWRLKLIGAALGGGGIGGGVGAAITAILSGGV
jgi:hypothetical protein